MKRLLPLCIVMLGACNKPLDTAMEKERILQADRDFAALSVKTNAAEAFKKYAREDAFQLPPNEEPIRGRDKIVERFAEFDKQFILDWEPQASEVAASGDLGYTWGIAKGISRETGKPVFRGKYLTVWKKDSDGNWRYIADLGNSSPLTPQ